MPYVIGHSFLPETLDLAEEYKLIAINEQKYYLYVCDFLKNNSYFLNNDLWHYIVETKSEYMKLLSGVNQQDKRYFASLVRTLIYEYYFEQLVKPNTDKPLSYFLRKVDILVKLNKPIPSMLQNKPETVMNTIDKYKNQASANVQLIHGK